MKIIKTIKNSLSGTKTVKVHSFSDYSAKEKVKIIRKATREANKIQKELTERYERRFAH